MFIRWKKINNEKYAYLETRYRGADGKIHGKSRYLGKNPLIALTRLVERGELNPEQVSYVYKNKDCCNSDLENLININGSIEIFLVLAALARRWKNDKNTGLALAAKDIITAAGKMNEYREYWRTAAKNKVGIFSKWLTLTRKLESQTFLSINDPKTKRALEILEGKIILTDILNNTEPLFIK
ncbi:MAG: hypothetical protein PHO01_11580 [Desulfotomaculaceae bacterium]|nr:hypothetical protein [Desulfotomaculaceae bacterium]